MSRESRRKPKADLRVESLEGKALLSTLAGSGGNNQAYVDSLYTQVLNRAPDAQGEAFWVNALDSGVGRRTVLSKFERSPEAVGTPGVTASRVSGGATSRARAFVDSLYETYLQRSATAEGEAFWVDQLRRGASRASVRAAIANSPEAQDLNGTGASGTDTSGTSGLGNAASLGYGMMAGSATTPGGTGGFGLGNGTGTYGIGTGTTTGFGTGTGTSSGLGGTGSGTISGFGTGSQGTGTGAGIGTTGIGTGTTGGSTTTGTTVGTAGNGPTTGTGTIGSGGGNTPTSSASFIGPISPFAPGGGFAPGGSVVGQQGTGSSVGVAATSGTPNYGTTTGTTATGAQQTNAPVNGNGTGSF